MGILAFFGFKKFDDGVYQLYSQIVAQARVVDFYTIQGVADTANGRFDLIALHAYIVMRRLKDIGEEGSQLSQDLFDIMFADMDKNIREMGVGDLSVGKKIKALAKSFYGRIFITNKNRRMNKSRLWLIMFYMRSSSRITGILSN